MKAYIQSYTTISRIDSFNNGILNGEPTNDIIHPDYKSVVPANLLRRMSKVIRMGIGSAIAAKGEREINGVIVGTGLGCLENTEKFLTQFIDRTEGILSPTAFIQSTHNTIAGQIGLILGDNSYNSTYTQRGQSFENALVDAILLSAEKPNNILVGGVDEKIDILDTFAKENNINLETLSEGASFFMISQDRTNAKSQIAGCFNFIANSEEVEANIVDFLKANDLKKPNLVLFGNSILNNNTPGFDLDTPIENYSDLSGAYMTNSAFALQLASEKIEANPEKYPEGILIVNNYNNKSFGLIYLQKP
ncbi:beta-ketoacyl synthase chain length factor [Crocinitomix catalasitica]|uniref:beta-ketoacyl synthase chain length factor n=1 Tax=Crocinitomix catalasitica TaxID=184607 RepID=UPI0006886041|nr:beta-ketoacyl synthase chain length factor [Crocinitomix catalasitica]